MESEFRRHGVSHSGPNFMRLMVDRLRSARQEHPVADFALGNLPIVGGAQAIDDVSNPQLSGVERALGGLSIIPGGKMVATAATILPFIRKGKSIDVQDLTPEEIFQKPDVSMTAEQREIARQLANKQYAEQLLKEEGMVTEKDRIREALYGAKYTSYKEGGFPKLGSGAKDPATDMSYTHDAPLTYEGVLAELLTSPFITKEAVDKRLAEIPEDLRFKINALRNDPKTLQSKRIMEKLGRKMQRSKDYVLDQASSRSNLVENIMNEKLEPIRKELRDRSRSGK